jgi:hypothetical protein
MGGKEKPTNFELIINLKTVKQNSLTISPNVLARADKSHRMIEDERPDLVSTAGFIYKVRFKPESSSGLNRTLGKAISKAIVRIVDGFRVLTEHARARFLWWSQ